MSAGPAAEPLKCRLQSKLRQRIGLPAGVSELEGLDLEVARGEIVVRPGKEAFEIWPSVEWNKGKTVLWLLEKSTQLFCISMIKTKRFNPEQLSGAGKDSYNNVLTINSRCC